MKFTNIIVLIMMSCIYSCKGGGSGSSDKPSGAPTTNAVYGTGTNISGLLLDAPISGVRYTSTSNSGTTSSTGSYTCKDGEVVSFSLSLMSLGSIICRSVVTPVELITGGKKSYLDLANLTSTESDKVNKLLVILQMMDTDSNPNNGITADIYKLYGLDIIVSNTYKYNIDEVVSDNTIFNTFKSGIIDTVRANSDANYYLAISAPTETSARTNFESTLNSITNCTTSDVANSASVTGINGICTALSCQTGFSINEQGLCIVNKTCADVHQIGVDTFSGTYPNCVAATCSTNFALTNGTCESTISNDYYCLQGTLHSAALETDALGEFPTLSLATMQNNSLKYNFVNPTTGEKVGRIYIPVTALFILRNGIIGSELRKRNANAVVSIPIGYWGKADNMLVVSAVRFNNPSNLIGNPLNERYFEWFLDSIYSDVIAMATSGATIAIDKRNDGFVLSQGVTPSYLNWTLSKNCSLASWEVNY
jgi:hypothetical protein